MAHARLNSRRCGPRGTRAAFAIGIAISMKGKGCWRDNVFLERLCLGKVLTLLRARHNVAELTGEVLATSAIRFLFHQMYILRHLPKEQPLDALVVKQLRS
jgi:hypothetical protein